MKSLLYQICNRRGRGSLRGYWTTFVDLGISLLICYDPIKEKRLVGGSQKNQHVSMKAFQELNFTKIEVEVGEQKETKKVTKDKKRERSGIPPPFFVSVEELYSIQGAWVKDGLVVLPDCKREPTRKKSEMRFTVGNIEEVMWSSRVMW